MALLSAQNLRIAFGGRPLLEDASLQVERRERIGLVGRNGEGKSTLLKILAGIVTPDAGELHHERGLRVTYLTHEVPKGVEGRVADVIGGGVADHVDRHHTVERLASVLLLDPSAPFDSLSGGQKRRVLLGRALAGEPDVLLLDEPTNHLDIESIEWMEGFLQRWTGSLLFVTHDRAFLQRLATRIVELDRGRLTAWACDYPTYLERKDALLAAEERAWEQQDRKLAAEETWIRRGIKARRTRNEGRVRALERLRAERAHRRDRVGRVSMSIQEGGRTSQRVIEVEGLGFAWPDQVIVRNLSTTILRGDVVGLLGPNGSGKTTLLRLLLGDLEPDTGSVRHGHALQVGYFDQHRGQLDENATVADAVSGGNEWVGFGEQRRHIFAYLEDFLFSAERARQPVRSLSGGERNRLLLARMFTRPANVLVLDEPTNDLDAETLELLEARLLDFGGTVLVVSHDRRFLDELCTSTLVFEGDGQVKEYVGGYSDWKRAVARKGRAVDGEGGATAGGPADEYAERAGASEGRPAASESPPRRLSYHEKKELAALPGQIEALEAELTALHDRMGDPDFYRGDPDTIRAAAERADALPARIDAVYARWSELEARA